MSPEQPGESFSEDFMEDLLDRLRYFAEACDYLSAVNCLVDLPGGFGGLACSVVERIAEDYGRSLCIPVWAFTETPNCSNAFGSDVLTLEQMSMKQCLQQLDIPLSYCKMIEHSHAFVAIEAVQSVSEILREAANVHNSSFVVALAIEAANSFHLSSSSVSSSSDRNSPAEWVSSTTVNGRFPVCSLEAYLQGFDEAENPVDFVLKSFSARRAAVDGRPPNVNPFAHSFSAAAHGSWSVESATAASLRPFSNSVSIRGDFPDGNLQLLAVGNE